MPTGYLSEVVRLAGVKRPFEQPSSEDWQAVESDLGFELPTDFKSLVSALGTGHFGMGLYLRNPSASSEYIRLSAEALVAYRENLLSFEQRTSFLFYPAQSGLIVIGSIDRDHFYLRPEPAPAVKQPSRLVHIDLDLAEASELDMPISQFIHALYLNRLGQNWAADLRTAIWRNGSVPFFTTMASASKRLP